MSVDAARVDRVRHPIVRATEPGPRTRRLGVFAAVVMPLAAAGISALSALVCLAAGIFGDVLIVGASAFGFSAVAYGACTALAATRRWHLAGWLSPIALLSTVVATSAVAGQHTSYSWGLAVAVGASASASAGVLFRSVTSSGSGQRGWSPAFLALGVVAASLVALLNPTPRPLPTDASHARVFVGAYQRDLTAAMREASTARLVGTTKDGLVPLPQSLCRIAARCEVQLERVTAGDLLFVPTYISWRNEYAGGLIRWTGQGPPPPIEAFTADVTPIEAVGNGWWWSEPR